jgi:fused signal recognition particle receptor
LNYRFKSYDYVIFALSYVFFALFAIDLSGQAVLPIDLPAWVYLIAAFLLNVWVIPLPGINPRLPKPEEVLPEIPPAQEIKAIPKEKPVPEKEAVTAQKKLEKGLAKTHKGFIERIAAVFSRHEKIDASVLNELEETLVGTDIGIRTAYKIFEDLKKDLSSVENASAAMDKVRDEISRILLQREKHLVIPENSKPFVIMVSGVNGSGKTTTIAKIAWMLKKQGKSVIIAAADTFRAAAIDQLEHWANRSGADFIKSQEGADPSAVAYDGLEAAISRGHDVLIIDTAGRLHTRENLMEELKKTKRVLDKKMPGTPQEIMLVLDATIGQNAIEQTRQFNNALGVTGLVLTKMDGSSKGGVIVGIADEFDIPIRFVGVGEAMDDLQEFEADHFVDALFKESDEA